MSWMMPVALLMGAVAVIAAIVVHLISPTRPAPELFPTARFVDTRAQRLTSRSMAPADVVLLLLRCAIVAALAAAVAGPVLVSRRENTARVVAVDRSRAVAAIEEVRDSIRALVRPGDVLIAFDSTADVIAGADALDTLANTRAHGSLSTALAATFRAGAALAREADSVEVVLITPALHDELDVASAQVRGAWPGRIRIVHVAGIEADTVPRPIVVSAPVGDPVGVAVDLAGLRAVGADVRLVRGAPTGADSVWARGSNHVLIHWPVHRAEAPSHDVVEDSIGAVVAAGMVVTAPFSRTWIPNGPVVARWSDGRPAATEDAFGEGCIRTVAIQVDPASDLALRPSFARLVAALARPCGSVDVARGDGLTPEALAGTGPLVTAAALEAGENALRTSGASAHAQNPSTRWELYLIVGALLLIVVETVVRRTRRGGLAQ